MRLVVDTNILFTQFWKNSFTKKLFTNKKLNLFSPEYALEEIKLHAGEILEKTKISKEEFNKLRKEMVILIKFVPLQGYSNLLKDLLNVISDSKDIDFLALALKLDCPIWSNDPHLKKQTKIQVYTTEEIFDWLNNE